jgi:hypothetical protein
MVMAVRNASSAGHLCVLTEIEFFEPVGNLLHRGNRFRRLSILLDQRSRWSTSGMLRLRVKQTRGSACVLVDERLMYQIVKK